MSQIKDLIMSSGERYPILVDSNGIPDFWITLYVTELLRPKLTQSSITNSIDHLIHLKFWEELNERDFILELSNASFLSDEDIYSIRNHCLLDRRSLKKWVNHVPPNAVILTLSSTFETSHIQSVSKTHAANRMTCIAEFLDFVARTSLKNRLVEEHVFTSIVNMKNNIFSARPKGKRRKLLVSDPNVVSAPPEAFEHLLSITKENSKTNPYKNECTRMRNALIFELLDATGMRSGELLGLQIGDIDFYHNMISVVRRHDATEDPRAKQPVAKTNERRIPIDNQLTSRLRDYIMGFRANIPTARKHPYLFVTHKAGKFLGRPISNSTFVNRVLKPAICVSPLLLEEISRHGFRHYFNYKLSKKIDAINEAAKKDPNIRPINEKMELQIRKELNGWNSDSTAETYNLRHIREEANRVMKEDLTYWSHFAET